MRNIEETNLSTLWQSLDANNTVSYTATLEDFTLAKHSSQWRWTEARSNSELTHPNKQQKNAALWWAQIVGNLVELWQYLSQWRIHFFVVHLWHWGAVVLANEVALLPRPQSEMFKWWLSGTGYYLLAVTVSKQSTSALWHLNTAKLPATNRIRLRDHSSNHSASWLVPIRHSSHTKTDNYTQ